MIILYWWLYLWFYLYFLFVYLYPECSLAACLKAGANFFVFVYLPQNFSGPVTHSGCNKPRLARFLQVKRHQCISVCVCGFVFVCVFVFMCVCVWLPSVYQHACHLVVIRGASGQKDLFVPFENLFCTLFAPDMTRFQYNTSNEPGRWMKMVK